MKDQIMARYLLLALVGRINNYQSPEGGRGELNISFARLSG